MQLNPVDTLESHVSIHFNSMYSVNFSASASFVSERRACFSV